MSDFSEARTNMMDCQILTAGVVSPPVLKAFETTPREEFVPDQYASVAYNDEDVPVGQGRFLLEPLVYAKMIEALDIQKDDVALDIGSGSGYSSAILSSLAATVVSLETDKELSEKAAGILPKLDACNIVSFDGDLKDGYAEQGPYNVIIFNGSISEVPNTILEQLAPNGRLIAIVKPANQVMGCVTLIKRSADLNNFSSHSLFEAGCPYLPEFLPEPSFKF